MVFTRKAALTAVAFLPLSIGLSTSAWSVSQIGLRPYQGATIHAHGARSNSRKNFLLMSTAAPAIKDPIKEEKIFEPLGMGVLRDFRRRLPLYKSDIRDGLNAQSLATILFLFFACLAPAIGFGGILDVATSGAMGVIEMVTSTAFCGVMYALCSAQPLQLIGPMGPNLAFTISLAQLADRMALPFLPLYAWTGLWTAGMLLVSALTSASNLVKYLTRFTDEIFSVLISSIFVVGAVTDVAKTFTSPVSTGTKALLTLTCAMVTFGSSIILKGLKNSVYFTKSIRNNLSNFAPAIGVTLGSLVARAVRVKYGSAVAALPVLSLPIKFATTTGRPWLIPLMDLPVWARWGAILPALLATVLLFLDQNITARLVNNPRYKMKKGRTMGNVLDGMHGDMLVLSLLTAITSLVGLPWMVGATARSIVYVRSLLLLDEAGSIRGTMENRVTGVAIHVLIGACVLFSGPRMLLSQVPLPVLSGVFMYLGLTSLQGLELWDRMKELFQDSSVAPTTRWSVVPNKSRRIVTGVQMACVGLMMWVTNSSLGVILPLIVALLPVLRLGLIKSGLVQKESMDVLDA
jgi:hypothetical protein